jgi:hypothetical protein
MMKGIEGGCLPRWEFLQSGVVQGILYGKIAEPSDGNYTQRVVNRRQQNHLRSWHPTCFIDRSISQAFAPEYRR